MITLGEALGNIKKKYRCGYCGTSYETHEDAVRHMLHNHVTTQEVTL